MPRHLLTILAGAALLAVVALIADLAMRSNRPADVTQPPAPTNVVQQPAPIQPTPAPPPPTVAPTLPPPAAVPTATRQPVPHGVSELTSLVYPKQEYFLYVPKSYDGSTRYRLLVVVHGDSRQAKGYLEQFTDFADDEHYILLAPYFPPDERFQQLG